MEFISPACKVPGNKKVLLIELKTENKKDFPQLFVFLPSSVTSDSAH